MVQRAICTLQGVGISQLDRGAWDWTGVPYCGRKVQASYAGEFPFSGYMSLLC